MDTIKLNENEVKVLAYLVDELGTLWDEKAFTGFANIVQSTGLELKVVRRSCRSLRRKGLAEFMRGLFNEDGEVAGAGYSNTEAGVAFLKRRRESESTKLPI